MSARTSLLLKLFGLHHLHLKNSKASSVEPKATIAEMEKSPRWSNLWSKTVRAVEKQQTCPKRGRKRQVTDQVRFRKSGKRQREGFEKGKKEILAKFWSTFGKPRVASGSEEEEFLKAFRKYLGHHDMERLLEFEFEVGGRKA